VVPLLIVIVISPTVPNRNPEAKIKSKITIKIKSRAEFPFRS
jgi:hypothetical protein